MCIKKYIIEFNLRKEEGICHYKTFLKNMERE